MITQEDLEVGKFFTTDGKDVWKMEYFCLTPTVRLKNLETSEERDFGLGGITANDFHKIEMPKIKRVGEE